MRYFLYATRLFAGLLVCCACLAVPAARADEAFIPFLDGLYERGYGDLAVDYLKQVSVRSDLPADFRAVLDLEMATALRVAAAETLNADESAQKLTAAQEYLEKFLKEHADHPRAAAAFVAFGDLASERGDKVLALALRAAKKDPKTPLFLDARKDFDEARPKYAKAVELYQTQFVAAVDEEKKAAEAAAEKPVRRPVRTSRVAAPTKVEIAESQLLGARFKLGGADYKLGRTYTDKKDPKRKAAFLAAIKEFDGIYQYNRQLRVGLYAHLYHGKAADEMGDELLALDVYDEVLANAPEGNVKIEPEWENLFAEVERSRLEIKLAEAQVLEVQMKTADAEIKRDEIITEAEDWMRERYAKPPQQRSLAYQSIAMLLAETELEKAKKLEGDERKKIEQHAKLLLTKAAAIPGPYMQEAILLKRTLSHVEGGGEFNDIKEALAVGDDAAKGARWDEALAAYQAGLEMAKASKLAADQKLIPVTRMALAGAYFYSGKTAEALDAAEALATDKTTDPKVAPTAAALAVNAALSLYIASGGKPEALERLMKITDFTVKTWPELSQADEARIALGKVNLAQSKPQEAIKVFEAVNPASDHYPSALYWAGMTRWVLHLRERQSAGADQAALAAERKKIVEELTGSLEAARTKQAAGGPPDKGVPDTTLLLAEVYLDGNEPALAVPLLDPVIAGMQKDKPKSLDKFTLRACTDGVRAYIATAEMAKAEGVANLLMAVGEDVPAVNNVLLKFVSTVKNNWKTAEATLIGGKADAKALSAATAAVAANKQLLGKMIEPMAKRKELGLVGTVLVGDTCFELGLNDKAGQMYQFVIDHEGDPAFVGNDPHVKSAITRVRSRLIGIKRAEKKYAEALTDVDKLIADNPRSLEPRMERGRILQGWSEEDSKHFRDAVAQWTELRTMLQRMRGKKPPEYYEVIYNAAFCLVQEAKQLKTKDERELKASQAEQLLKSTRTYNPNLSGPEMVAKYDVLLIEAMAIQGRKPQPPAAANPQAANK
jgi:tetratricopeptide (TPR) repeat protein